MRYLIDPSPGTVAAADRRWDAEATIVVVGCGGTGGFVAESVCRLLLGKRANLYFVDPDRVEPHNVARQAFDAADVGHFKAQVLAERLARRFHREVGYSVCPYDREVHSEVFGHARSRLNLVIGCVDNVAARRALAATLEERPGYYPSPGAPSPIWWLDAGNGRNSGQILIGNATRPEHLRCAFLPSMSRCRVLPAPSVQRPDLLDALPGPSPRPDCAEAVAVGDQGPTINQVVAAVVASYVEKLLTGTLDWMASYLDLDDGTLRCVPADPKVVADLVGLHVNAVAPPGRSS
jgi:PRTRC genetic system ThiF family protein